MPLLVDKAPEPSNKAEHGDAKVRPQKPFVLLRDMLDS
jgi:hypothetical protein